MTRECQPAGHYNEENGKKWANSNITECEGEKTEQLSCSGIYGNWAQWSKCNKSCVNKDESPSIRTRQRNCNETITNSGKFINQNKHSKKSSGETCELEKQIEMEVCQRSFCEKCANFETPCAGVNEECIDIDDSKTCLCKKPFLRDEFGDCNKCNALRPFSWQCAAGKYFVI